MPTVGKNGFAAIQIIILHLTSLSIGAYRRRWHRGDKVFSREARKSTQFAVPSAKGCS
jgi:hypothetical protein